MKKARFIVTILLILSLLLTMFGLNYNASANTEPTMSIRLSYYLNNVSSLNVKFTGSFTNNKNVKLESNKTYLMKLENDSLKLYSGNKLVGDLGKTFTLIPNQVSEKNLVEINGRPYMGKMTFTIENQKYIRPINELPLEEYLKGVVPREMPDSWGKNGGMEALKAQAVAARTFAMKYIGTTITDTESHQVYGGYTNSPNAKKAVEETKGVVVEYKGRLASLFYSSGNGGKVLSNTNSWGSSLVPYLLTKDDPYDLRSSNPNKDWNYKLSKTQINIAKQNLAKPQDWWNSVTEKDSVLIGNIKKWLTSRNLVPADYEIKIIEISNISFLTKFKDNDKITGSIALKYIAKNKKTNQYVIENKKIKIHNLTINDRSYNIRSMIGASVMKSPYIKKVEYNGTQFIVHGGGYGHGIGMSQYGAYQMSKEGKTYRDILLFYFPGTNLNVLYPYEVKELKITQPAVSVDGSKKVSISYHLSNDAKTTIQLRDTKTGKVYTILNNKDQKEGVNKIDYDGKNLNGYFAATIKATDANGSKDEIQLKGSIYLPPYQYEKTSFKLTLNERTYLYKEPIESTIQRNLWLAPQTVQVLAKTKDNKFYQIATWVGPHWIKVQKDIIPLNKKITVYERKYLYKSPSEKDKTRNSIAPQTVFAIEATKNGFVKIRTWIGDMYIKHTIN